MPTRIEALAKFLGCEVEDIDGEGKWGDCLYTYGREEYLVLTDEEADERAKEAILDSVWAFNPSFLRCHMGLPGEGEEMLKCMQEKKCEDANATFRAMLKDEDHFVEDAIRADGRGHFLAGYDGEESEAGGFFIYRVN